MIKHLSLFSGIESFKKALTNLGIDNELVGYSEFDKYASVALSAIHGVSEELNYGDITKIDETKVPDCDLITYGFPCQDISIAGHQKGIVEGETRSGLLYDALRIIKYKKPKYAIAENVKNLVGKKFKDDFNSLLEELDSYGYNNYWQVLNAKDYGIPQNRERVFIVSIRKDVDNGKFEFPKPFDSGLRLKDLLEDKVEDKYYIENERVDELLSRLKDGKLGQYPKMENGPVTSSALSSREHRASGWSETVGTLCARDYKDPKVVAEPKLVGGVGEKNFGTQYRQGNRVYDAEEIAMCLLAQPVGNAGGNSYLYKVAEPIIVASRGRNPNNPSDRAVGSPTEQRLEPNSQGISNTLTTVQKDNLILEPKVVQAVGDRGNHSYSVKDYAFTIPANPMSDRGQMVLEPNELRFVGGIGNKDWAGDGKEFSRNYPQGNRIYNANGIACSQTAQGGGVGSYTGLYLEEQSPNELKLHTNLSGGKWDKIHESARRVYDQEGIAPTIPTCGGGNIEPKVQTDYKIRKLTPKECWRLMGFDDEDYWKARKGLEEKFYNGGDRSNSQMYKMAGNSIVVDVLEGILGNLFNEVK